VRPHNASSDAGRDSGYIAFAIKGFAPMAGQAEHRHGYTISWQEPPLTSAQWDFNSASADPDLQARIGRSAHVIAAPSREHGLMMAREYIDGLLDN
jgi:hypothetical protein